MPAPKGNRFWEKRAKSGRNKIFSTPQDLWDAAVGYFEWVDDNPLWETKVAQYQGAPVEMTIPKMRAMTIDGFCLYLGVNRKYLYEFESNLDLSSEEGKDFSNIIAAIKSTIRQQKFEGAAAELLNSNIIARDLGLVDKQQAELGGIDGGAIKTESKVEWVVQPVKPVNEA